MKAIHSRGLVLLALAAVAAAAAAQDEEPPERGWSDTAELSLVATAGNAEAFTLGFKNVLRWRGERSQARAEASGLRATSEVTGRTAVAGPDGITVRETSVSETTAERYNLRGRYDRSVSERFFWYVASGWQRNEFAGFKSRTSAGAGVGHVWFERQEASFRTDYGVTVTREEDVVPGPDSERTFAGLGASWEYARRLTATTSYGNDLSLDANLDETEDWRAAMSQSLKVKMSDRLALQVELEALYDNQPSGVEVAVVDAFGAATGQVVRVPLDSLDSTLTVALVVDF